MTTSGSGKGERRTNTHISNLLIFIDNCEPLRYNIVEKGVHVVGCSSIHKRRAIPGIRSKNSEFFSSKIHTLSKKRRARKKVDQKNREKYRKKSKK